MTHEDIVYDRRVRLINYAAKIDNVTLACEVFGVSRKSYYKWLGLAEQYGLSALLPKGRRAPHQPHQMSSEEVAIILAGRARPDQPMADRPSHPGLYPRAGRRHEAGATPRSATSRGLHGADTRRPDPSGTQSRTRRRTATSGPG